MPKEKDNTTDIYCERIDFCISRGLNVDGAHKLVLEETITFDEQ